MTADILGVILAGGRATRMGGGDKALLTLGGRSLIDRVIERFGPQVGAMMLNANGDPARFAAYDLAVRGDEAPDRPGPLAGVLAGLDWAAERGGDSIVTVAADTPFFPRDLVVRLQDAARGAGAPIALAASPDPVKGMMRHPTFGLWPVALREDLRCALAGGVRKIAAWADAHGAATAPFAWAEGGVFGASGGGAGFDPFYNLNTPDDLARGDALLRSFEP